ncbi:MAG: hypothetical protein K0Q87_1042 [Neobacillus sp.]|nr:hypothetical protein [Neobacillus sp.]
MRIEHVILIAMWLFGVVAFFLFIPRKDRRKGFLAYLMFQAIIWLCDMPAFKYDMLSAPVREMPKATDLPLTIDYFFYPVLFSIYYVRKKANGRLWSRVTYLFIWISASTLFDLVIERNTELISHEKLPLYGMWIYIGFLFFVSQVCCNWFFKDKDLFQAERWKTNEN